MDKKHISNSDKNIYYHVVCATILSIIATLFSVLALCVTYPRVIGGEKSLNLGFDYLGIIVGALSILVALLLGWQIFSVIKLEDYIKKVAQKEMEKAADSTYKAIIGNSLRQQIKDARYYTIDGDFNRVLSLYNSILEGYILLEDKSHVEEIVSNIKTLFEIHGVHIYSFYKEDTKKFLKQAIPYTNDAYELLRKLD